MGTLVAQDIFQSKLDSIFIGMEDVTGIADDMVIAGRDEMEHGRNFLVFMEKCMSNSLTLNLEKIQFKQSQVSFYGHYWSKHGISPDPKKIQACNHMEFPLDKESMRSFLGMSQNLYGSPGKHPIPSKQPEYCDKMSCFINGSLFTEVLPLCGCLNFLKASNSPGLQT